MLDRIITHGDLLALVDTLSGARRIIGPVARRYPDATPPVRYFYEVVERAAQLDLAFNYCVFGPKRFLFPPAETLFRFERGPGRFKAEPVFDPTPLAFIGVHPCDIRAIHSLDGVFTNEQRDEHYLARRDHAFVVGVDCARPCTSGVFCKDMGAHEVDSGFDLMLYPLGTAAAAGPHLTPAGSLYDAPPAPNPAALGPLPAEFRFGVKFGTPAGREWILRSTGAAHPTAADERAFERYQKGKDGAFDYALTTRAAELPALLKRSYDSLLWEATARRCYSCGSCNLVCPTCYCFNVTDELDVSLSGGVRQREWDGCQLRDFALVAGGHNFRVKPGARLRHRIYRKAMWIAERSGVPGCVGCARCDRACTAKISSVEIYNQLAEEV